MVEYDGATQVLLQFVFCPFFLVHGIYAYWMQEPSCKTVGILKEKAALHFNPLLWCDRVGLFELRVQGYFEGEIVFIFFRFKCVYVIDCRVERVFILKNLPYGLALVIDIEEAPGQDEWQ